MLFRTLGYLSSFANIATILMLVRNGVIQKIGSAHWSIGVGSMLFLSIISIAFFYLNNEKEGITTLRLYSYLYAVLSILLYSFIAIRNFFIEFEVETFVGYLFILAVLSLIALITITYSRRNHKEVFLSGLSSSLSLLSLGVTFGTIYKYVFMQQPIIFHHLSMELSMIFLGWFMFIISNIYLNKK